MVGSEGSLTERIPTVEESIVAMRELLVIWRASKSIDVPIIDDSLLPAVTIRALVEHAVSLTDSVILLAEHGHFSQAAGLSRSTMECAVTAAWMSVTPKAGNAVAHEWARNRKNLFEAWAMDTALDLSPDIEEAQQMMLDWREDASAAARNFQRLCGQLIGGGQLYGVYRALSGYVHAGPGLADLYVTQTAKTETAPDGWAFLERAAYKMTDEAMAMHVAMLSLAMSAWDLIDPKHPDDVALQAKADRFGYGRTIKRVE
ncbi:hypothetical protein EDF46_1938 [Frondihabitans sp. PhB188]|uniref:DUF5677 domain-containing protein n=1 Tax=Frondihabitans sp. PhB188 TaxID=2485200 RepID=UPI000F47DD23|nr:DUF5677 domain-containing protein [Frondihabitans sp. PhB188]ROQ38308.1 hypothetical protein EDF46_1938 [Frondihabitans sp. PhB188]